ncbi:hypothetical protein [Bordetella genomosp. 5]|uniref:hypothetical protein n=1 Tax=Bordetella genomosp. 5 TaxID=1395608 RepID=UPI0020CBE39F|nr:hypothetical protein [Bordetella genomosp. 5]
MSINGINTAGIQSIDLSSMDLETALMQVQQQRTQLLDSTLRSQMDAVNQRNQDIAGLNEKSAALRNANTDMESANVDMTAKIAEYKDLADRLAASKCPDPNGWYGLSFGQGDNGDLSFKTLDQIKAAGLDIPGGDNAPRNVDGNHTMDAKGWVVQSFIDQLGAKIAGMEESIKTNTATIKTNNDAIADNKNAIDSLSNSQQMDMLRLQSLSNKRNEAFDVMTNFIKKMQDNRSSIVGNMR